MIYIIDNNITYNSDDCTLFHIPTQESLSLSISSGRLFEQLLNSEGEILARDTLLTEVWDKYGLRGSNSNLNQYLSILRRALAAYGCENLIITIPKMGIRLNTEIKIERELPPAPEFIASLPEKISAEAAENTHSEHPTRHADPALSDSAVRQPLFIYRYLISIIILIAMLGGAFWYQTSKNSTEISLPMSVLKLTGGCEAVIIDGLDVNEQQSLSQQILQMLRENNQSCVPGRKIYFDKNTAFNTTNYGRTILSVCDLNSSDHISSCENFYYLDWRLN